METDETRLEQYIGSFKSDLKEVESAVVALAEGRFPLRCYTEPELWMLGERLNSLHIEVGAVLHEVNAALAIRRGK